MDIASRVAEVIETSSAEFMAQCYKLDQAPPLGSFVKTGDDSGQIYGVVYNVETHSLEPGRRVIARGEGLNTEQDLFRANPHLAKLLATDFKALVVGYRQGRETFYFLPPKPAFIHSFVHVCQIEEVKMFTESLDFISLLVDARLPIATDEVVASCVRYASSAYPEPQPFLVKAGKELARLLSGDVHRLDSILRKIKR